MGRTSIDIIGKVFHQLTVLHRDGVNEYSKPMYVCKCSCGKLTRTQGSYLKIGKTKSCGCRTTATHHLSKHPLHGIRNAIKMRCYNPSCKSYRFYGAKGIKMCEEWKTNFESFFNWCIKNGWERGVTFDRINPLGNYEPSNCRFISRSENSYRLREPFIGKIHGTWKIMEKEPGSSKAKVKCIKCGKEDFLTATNVRREVSKQCKCI